MIFMQHIWTVFIISSNYLWKKCNWSRWKENFQDNFIHTIPKTDFLRIFIIGNVDNFCPFGRLRITLSSGFLYIFLRWKIPVGYLVVAVYWTMISWRSVSKGGRTLGVLYSIKLTSSEPRIIHRIIKENMRQKFLGDRL